MSNLIAINFSEYSQPKFTEKKNQDWVSYGEDNKFPLHLLSLLNTSAKHNAIVNGKANYIAGGGIVFDDEANQYLVEKPINRSKENINDILDKITLDIETFGGCYLEIIYNHFGDAVSLYHIDYAKVRSNPDNTYFYISNEWDVKAKPNDIESISAFNPDNKVGKQLIYLKEYRPGVNTYTLPTYQGALNYIELDVAVSEFHLNAIHNGMMPSKMLSFNNGIPTEEEQRKIERQVKDKFSGEKNAGKFIINFNNDPAKAPTVIDLSASDLDKQFDMLNKTIQQEIFSGHRITSASLFGIAQEGALGARTEMRDAYEIFQNTYVSGKQQFIERWLGYILPLFGITAEFHIKHTEPLGFEFSEAIISANMTREEIREKLGLPLEVKPVAVPEVTNQAFSQQDDDFAVSVFADFGDARSDYNVIKSRRVQFDDNFEPIPHQEFADIDIIITNVQSGILDLLQKNPLTTVDDMAIALKVDKQVIIGSLSTLENNSLINVKPFNDNGSEVISREITDEGKKQKSARKPIADIQIRYSYEVTPGLGAPIIPTTRRFCENLITLDKIYSRAEIQAISQRLGYSVWQRRGGFYTNPRTQVTTPYCRHRWVEQVVIKRR
jgi:hypothetical protein